MRPLLLVLLASCTSQPQWPADAPPEACAAGAIGAEERVLRLESGGRMRSALVWHPTGPGPHDVIVTLHSFRSEPRRQAHYSGWYPFHEQANAILVAPDGVAATWSAGECCGRSLEKNVNDLAFLDALVERIEQTSCTTGRVLVTGLGNGAMMADAWACESDVPDAVVAAGGVLQAPECRNERPIPVVHVHATEDPWSPADGSTGHRPLAHGVEAWTKRNRAQGEPTVETDGPLTCRTWEADAPTVFCTLDAAHSGWPGAADLKVETSLPHGSLTEGGWKVVREGWR